jgi:GNAT superfamily N-acetyltransferase
VAAPLAAHRDAVIALNVEYLTWVYAGVAQTLGVSAQAANGLSPEEYVPTVVDRVCGQHPPHGVFYLVRLNGQWVGMGGLRQLAPGVMEIKRIYFRPAARGLGLGARLLQRLLADAQALGARQLMLDTAPFMAAAQRLYADHGFSNCPAYAGAEVPEDLHPHWRFMTRAV